MTRRTTDHGDGGGGTDPPPLSCGEDETETDHGDGGGGTDPPLFCGGDETKDGSWRRRRRPPLFWRQRDELTSAFTLDLSECSDITSNGAINPRLGLLKYNSKSTSNEGSRVPN